MPDFHLYNSLVGYLILTGLHSDSFGHVVADGWKKDKDEAKLAKSRDGWRFRLEWCDWCGKRGATGYASKRFNC
jgi:hypothetical protein